MKSHSSSFGRFEEERSALYGGNTAEQLLPAVERIRFIACGKAHEFGEEGAAECKLRSINGCCAHQRPFRELGDWNAATVMEDALAVLLNEKMLRDEEHINAIRLIRESRRALERLDLTAALSQSAMSGNGIVHPENIGLPHNVETMDQVREFIRVQERAIGERLTTLHQDILRLLHMLCNKTEKKISLPIVTT